ncbi:MAG TPA: heparan-alpha-glucosaminide N-acetyltransferase domain-containing protein, partial [Bacteroidota bacterium]|nr:heparan-alpha-glucosaminide N-acetyltransferase domain-containing protein [Bacteroidota bacterium]
MQQPSPKKRIEFIDLLRGWAVIVMIQTHVFNATLTPEITGSAFFEIIRFIDGLVAPSFLFASGMAYAVTTRRKMADYLSFGMPLVRQIGRLLFIMLIGYSLHIPRFNYYHLR